MFLVIITKLNERKDFVSDYNSNAMASIKFFSHYFFQNRMSHVTF